MDDNRINNIERKKKLMLDLKCLIRKIEDKRMLEIFSNCQTALNKNDKLLFEFHLLGLLTCLCKKIGAEDFCKSRNINLNEIAAEYEILAESIQAD